MTAKSALQTAPVPRAGRYPLRTAIRFRVRGDDKWREGITEDISRTGVFLRSHFLPPTGAEIEMILSLPGQVWGKSAGEVMGQGRVVRQEPSAGLEPEPGMAATIERYRLARKDAILPEILRKS